MANTAFYLKRSRVAIVFQIGILILILSLVSGLLPLWLSCSISIMLLLSLYAHFRRPQLHYFEPFSMHEWSIGVSEQEVQQMTLHRVVDHHWYVVLYFQQKKPCSYVIWYDQLALKDWKRLKLLAKMF